VATLPHNPSRLAWRHGGALLLTVALGLLSRKLQLNIPLWDKSLGDVLYAVAVYFVLALIRPGWQPRHVAGWSLLFCLAIETFQLTPIPMRLSHNPLLRLLLGTTFAWHDVACYLVGAVCAWGLDQAALRNIPQAEAAG
jgi:hypothetical protein